MEKVRALPARRDVFVDQRGTGLRVTWHPEQDLVVLSLWHDDHCVGTFRMPIQDAPRLSGLLAAALDDWVTEVSSSGPQPERGTATGLSIRQRLRLSRAVLKLRRLQHKLKSTA